MITYSVVIPVFNRAHTLKRAVASVLAQTTAPCDIVIVDDGSTDESVDVAEKLARANPVITAIQLGSNRGAPHARNVGAQHVRGDVLAFFDSDDEWLNTKAERQLALLAANPAAPASFTRILVPYADGRRLSDPVPAVVHRADLFKRNIVGGTSSAMIRRTALTLVDGFRSDMPSCQDWDLWLALAALGPLVVCQEALTIHHLDAQNRITEHPNRVIDGQRRITEQLRSELSGRPLKRIMAAHDFNVASILAKQAAQPKKAASFALRGWKRSPSIGSTIQAAKLLIGIARDQLRSGRNR